MPSHLCKICHSALVDRDYRKYEKKDTEEFHITFALLEKSAAGGCLVCSQLLNKFTLEYRDRLREIALTCTTEQEKRSSVRFGFNYWLYPTIRVTAKFNFPNTKPTDTLWHVLYLVPAYDVKSSFHFREISPFTGSTLSFATAKRWLDGCLSHHDLCAPRSALFNPTRLVDLGLEEIPRPRLLEVPAACEKLSYMTLSHCWGCSVRYTLTSTGLKSMLATIPMPELSKTLQDAMLLARGLGIRYIWIDTLCIIQDSVADWRNESARMGDVYKNSVCTIAASAASNGDAGCFLQRDIKLIKPCKIRNVSLRGVEEYYCLDRDIWGSEIEDAPLNYRGWVLQELLLSPRTLHFGRNQVFYTCRKLEACETFPGGLPRAILIGIVKDISDELLAPVHSYDRATFAWEQIVEHYSQRKLTKGEDKLVAVSGLAKEMRLILDDEYLAGIWRKNLPWGLLREISAADVPDAVRFPGYRAPSWSWASLDGKILMPYKKAGTSTFVDLAEVLEVHIESSAGDPVTQVSYGFIRLKGRLTKCRLDRKDGPMFEEVWGQTSKGNQKLAGTVSPDTPGSRNDVVEDLWCLPVMMRGVNFTDCVLLQHAEQKGTFARFGAFTSRWDAKEGTDLFKHSCDVFDNSFAKNDFEYEETKEGKKYTITII